jgi:hypothetical protein
MTRTTRVVCAAPLLLVLVPLAVIVGTTATLLDDFQERLAAWLLALDRFVEKG